VALFSIAALFLTARQGAGQQTQDSGAARTDSGKAAPATPTWRDSVRYGGGPSVGAPPSDYTGETPPAQWCLQATRRAPGDFGVTGQNWTQASRSWLRQVLSDTTHHGNVWRQVLGGAPQLAATDSIVQVTDEDTCRAIAEILNRELLGWKVGPPTRGGVPRPGLSHCISLERTYGGVRHGCWYEPRAPGPRDRHLVASVVDKRGDRPAHRPRSAIVPLNPAAKAGS
jgi:hypothetical protein